MLHRRFFVPAATADRLLLDRRKAVNVNGCALPFCPFSALGGQQRKSKGKQKCYSIVFLIPARSHKTHPWGDNFIQGDDDDMVHRRSCHPPHGMVCVRRSDRPRPSQLASQVVFVYTKTHPPLVLCCCCLFLFCSTTGRPGGRPPHHNSGWTFLPFRHFPFAKCRAPRRLFGLQRKDEWWGRLSLALSLSLSRSRSFCQRL